MSDLKFNPDKLCFATWDVTSCEDMALFWAAHPEEIRSFWEDLRQQDVGVLRWVCAEIKAAIGHGLDSHWYEWARSHLHDVGQGEFIPGVML